MKVYLIRHSRAVLEGGQLIDEHRYLSIEGRARAVAVGRALGVAGVRFDRVLTSPLVRAVQTAELIARELAFAADVEVLVALSPGLPPDVAARQIGAAGQPAQRAATANLAGSVALVGHEPGISALGAVLVSRPSFPPFKPGQVSLIEDGRPGWTLNPDSLEREPLLVA